MKYRSEIDKINFERNELQNIRNEYAQVLGRKFQDIIKKQNLYYKLLDKSLESYENYDLTENKDEQKKLFICSILIFLNILKIILLLIHKNINIYKFNYYISSLDNVLQ